MNLNRPPPPRPTKEQVVHMRAEEYKVEGNVLYGKKQYLLASKKYDLAIALEPNNAISMQPSSLLVDGWQLRKSGGRCQHSYQTGSIVSACIRKGRESLLGPGEVFQSSDAPKTLRELATSEEDTPKMRSKVQEMKSEICKKLRNLTNYW